MAQPTSSNGSGGGGGGGGTVGDWKVSDVLVWASSVERCSANIVNCLQREEIDGEVLMALTEDDIRDFRYRLNYALTFSDLKKFWLSVRDLQQRNQSGSVDRLPPFTVLLAPDSASPLRRLTAYGAMLPPSSGAACECCPSSVICEPNNHAKNIPPEFFKTAISLGYSFLVTWITSFVMVIVHERVPDMKRYPPLPDIFLDNVPHIPWAFHMCEITGTLLFAIWSCVCIFHRYRTVLLRRFFALAGTVFLLRCVTMLITSLSVPGAHLQCNQTDYAIDDNKLTAAEALHLRITRAYTIWSGLGMSIQGVRTCGDYMFSGHTVALTLMNFFITEYTPRNLYFLHTLTWLLNMFGIFFILAAHEHYSIDVFVAFYITSRLFLYYHTLANNQALMSRDSNRTRIWFPMFSYFESSVDGIIPNQFDNIEDLRNALMDFVLGLRDSCLLTARRFWIDPPQLALTTSNMLFVPPASTPAAAAAGGAAVDDGGGTVRQRNAATSTHNSTSNTPVTQTSLTSFGSISSARLSDSAVDKERSASDTDKRRA